VAEGHVVERQGKTLNGDFMNDKTKQENNEAKPEPQGGAADETLLGDGQKFLKLCDGEVYLVVTTDGETDCIKAGCTASIDNTKCDKLRKYCNFKDIVFHDFIVQGNRCG